PPGRAQPEPGVVPARHRGGAAAERPGPQGPGRVGRPPRRGGAAARRQRGVRRRALAGVVRRLHARHAVAGLSPGRAGTPPHSSLPSAACCVVKSAKRSFATEFINNAKSFQLKRTGSRDASATATRSEAGNGQGSRSSLLFMYTNV